jgi:hypothetical protein
MDAEDVAQYLVDNIETIPESLRLSGFMDNVSEHAKQIHRKLDFSHMYDQIDMIVTMIAEDEEEEDK